MSSRLSHRVGRVLRHFRCDRRHARRLFPERLLAAVEARIAAGEAAHGGELRLAVEASLPLARAWRGVRPRERALEVFGKLRVWDTGGNNGVLLYVLLADRAVEIVADRAAAAAIPAEHWQEATHALAGAFRAGRYEDGVMAAIDRINQLLAAAFPLPSGNRGELPDRPELL